MLAQNLTICTLRLGKQMQRAKYGARQHLVGTAFLPYDIETFYSTMIGQKAEKSPLKATDVFSPKGCSFL
jgi:hypothetical protein